VIARGSKARAWLETVLAVVGLSLCLLTLVWREWIEFLFGVDPDRHSGAMELLVAGAFLVASVVLGRLARREWRIRRRAGSPVSEAPT
jgi:hypothetical protein